MTEFLSYRDKFIDLLWKSVEWFLYDRDLRHNRDKQIVAAQLRDLPKTEAVLCRCSSKYVLLKACNFIKKRRPFPDTAKFLRTPFLYRIPPVATFAVNSNIRESKMFKSSNQLGIISSIDI